jgi:hypothetical protein
MSNKFLGTTGAEIDVTNGSTVLYGSTIGAKSLKPSYAVKTNSAGNLISTKLFISDVENLQQKLNSVITNPYAGDLESKSFVSNNIYDTTRTSNINLSNDTINIVSESVKINGETVITAGTNIVQNPMTEDLNCNTNNLTNIGLLNGYDIGTINSDLNNVKDKTFHIQLPLSGLGTIFSENVYADKFVTNGATNQQYVMGDGTTLQYSANSGNSNFYLYNNGSDQDTTPPNGFITYNNAIQDNATFIYINHRTKDTIDIEVFFKNLSTLNDVYIQDQENSDNNITYNITGNPIIVNQAQVTIPVIKRTSNGTGSSSFGINHNLLLSFFTNSIETDIRLSNLETKTQHITANNSNTIFNKTIFHRLGLTDALRVVSSEVGEPFIFDVSRTIINAYKQLHMNNQAVTNATGYATQGGLSSGFLKANGSIDSSAYITSTNAVITNLQNKTQNITGSLIGTDITNNLSIILRVANGDFFTIRNDATPVSTNKFNVSNTSVQISSIPLQMNNQKIQFLATPVDNSDATRKDYVDNLITPLQTATQNLTASAIVSTFRKDIQFKLDGSEAFVITNNNFIPVNKLLVTTTSVEAGVNLTAPAFIKTGGLTTQFLKANGDIDSNTYVTTASVSNKLNIDGSNAMTGALNMGNQAINNSGIISAVGFIKDGGLNTQFLKADGASDSRILNGVQVIQTTFQVGANNTTLEVNLTASPDIGSYTWNDNVVGITRRWQFYAISTRGTGNTAYTMRFKSSLGTMFEWVLPNLPQNTTNQPIHITMTVTRRLPTSLVFYGKWDCSSTGTTQGFWTATTTTTNVPALFNGSNYNVSIQSNNANANITFQYIEVQNVYG